MNVFKLAETKRARNWKLVLVGTLTLLSKQHPTPSGIRGGMFYVLSMNDALAQEAHINKKCIFKILYSFMTTGTDGP